MDNSEVTDAPRLMTWDVRLAQKDDESLFPEVLVSLRLGLEIGPPRATVIMSRADALRLARHLEKAAWMVLDPTSA